MNKAQLVKAIARRTRHPVSHVKEIVDLLFGAPGRDRPGTTSLIVAHLARGHEVSIAGFGVFETNETADRVGHNPRTGERLSIPASRRAKFRWSKNVKTQIRDHFASGAITTQDAELDADLADEGEE